MLKECDRTQYLCIVAGVCNGNTEGHVMSPYHVGARGVVNMFKRLVRVCRSDVVFSVEIYFTSRAPVMSEVHSGSTKYWIFEAPSRGVMYIAARAGIRSSRNKGGDEPLATRAVVLHRNEDSSESCLGSRVIIT